MSFVISFVSLVVNLKNLIKGQALRNEKKKTRGQFCPLVNLKSDVILQLWDDNLFSLGVNADNIQPRAQSLRYKDSLCTDALDQTAIQIKNGYV